ncbi:TonB-dependent receptor domain-containing protein [Mangrovibacterium sp.]|uniref:TonB-dependent receptor n=1 Tax=Mangrovibacterium sp. TaxID=1961364 RepID=UPI003567E4FE
MNRLINFIIFTLMCFPLVGLSQKVELRGNIYDGDSKEPLYYAAINLKGTPVYDLTDEYGSFQLTNIIPGKYTLLITLLGYQSFEKELEITNSDLKLNFYLNQASLSLDDVVVTAKVAQSKEGSTSYKIGTDAIQQVQPISVSDILQLIPGNQVGQTNLNSSAQINLRNADNSTSIDAFGTSVIVDGNQYSNDGNMQQGLNSTANKGVDLREISASNIESVEVISGVPSAKYGNITSGALIINKKAGYSPWRANFNSTPTTYQGGLNKGYRLNKGGFLNTDFDYTYSNSSATSRKHYYQRINTGVRWTNEFSKKLSWNNNLSLQYGFYFDGQRRDPDEAVVIAESESRSHSLKFGTNGSLKFLGKTNYSLNANYQNQYALKNIAEDGPIPIIESLEEGTYITGFSPISFFQKTESYGEPLNINGRIDTEQSLKLFGLLHNTNIGFEYSFNKNYGRGRVIDSEGAAVATGAGARDMNFYNVPASEIYSLYFQDDISLDREKSNYLLKLGLRYDNMLKRYNLVSPRLSLSARYFAKLRLRLAYGLSYKAPSMLQLYPGPVYFDIVNLNHYSEEDIRSLAVVTTHIYQPTNEHLRPSKGNTLEGGFDFEHNGFSFRATAFRKEIGNGITSAELIRSYEKQIWEVIEQLPNQAPTVAASDSSLYVSSKMSYYANALSSTTNGLEFSIQFPKIKATNTTINLSGSFLETKSRQTTPNIASSVSLTGAQKNRYGVYDNPAWQTTTSRSNLTIVQHIPEIKLLFTLIAETNWTYKREVVSIPSPYPIAYYSNTGDYVEIPEELRSSEAYSDLYYSPDFYNDTPTPTYFNFHLQVRKETKQGHNFSFYANNFLWHNPTYTDSADKTINYLNDRITFGFGLNFKL